MKSLVDKFLSLRCAGDVLESLQPLNGDVTRRIAESMALIEAIRPLVLKQRGEWKLMEFGVGIPLTSVIAAHLLPIEHSVAVVRRPKFNQELIDRVRHLKVYSVDSDDDESLKDKPLNKTIIVASNVNQGLAETVAEMSNVADAPMAMIPSRGKVKLSVSGNDVAKLTGNRYFAWLQELAESCDGKVRVPTSLLDNRIMNCCLVTRGL